MIQIHPRITNEQKRHLEQIASENNISVNNLVSKIIEDYLADYYSNSETEKSLPVLEKMMNDNFNEWSKHIRSLIARGVLDNAVTMLGVIDLVAKETGQSQRDLYNMYRELAYVRVKDRDELFKDLSTLEKYKEEIDNE